MDPTPPPHRAPQPDDPGSRPAVLLLATTLPARSGDGTPEFVLTLARSIPGYDVTVVAPRMPGAPRDEVIDGVRIRRVRYFPRRFEGLATDAIMPTLRAQPWRVVEVPFLFGALLLATWREVGRRRPLVVNAHWIVPAGLVALLVHTVRRTPYVVTVHGADAYTMRGALARRVKSLVLRHAALVLPVSGHIAREVGAEGAPVLRMGVDTRAVRDAVTRSPEPGLLLAIARLADKKGIDVLVAATARLEGAHLEVIGDGPERQALERQVRDLGVEGRVRFRGRLPRAGVLEALGRAQAVVIPSRVGANGDMEGTPVVLSEAMAAGVPVVASDLGGLAECVTDGVDGLLVPPDDVDALAAALDKVVNGGVDLEGLGSAARATAARRLDAGVVGAEYGRAFASLSERAPTAP